MTVKLNGVKPSPSNLVYNKFETAKTGLVKLGSSASSGEHIIKELTPVSNQLSLSSCVANATCDALEILLGLEHSVIQLSRLFIYWNARVYNNDTDKDEGTFIANAFDSLQLLGVCPESDWPYDTRMVYTQPNISCYKTANDNQITSYYRIDSYGNERLDDIEAAIRADHPVVFATAVNQSFINYGGGGGGGGTVWDAPATSAGNHAMIVTGVKRDPGLQFYIRNSWGTGWGDNGHCWMSADYLMSSKTFDIWVPTRVGDLVL